MVDIQQNGDIVLFVDTNKVLHDLAGRNRVQRSHRLVRKDDFGILVECAGERHALLLSAGHLIAAGIGLVQDADLIQTLQGAHLLFLAENAAEHTEEIHIGHIGCQNIFQCRAAGNQVEALENHADLTAIPAQLLALECIDIDTVNRQCAAGHIVHTVDAAQNGRFAGAGEADDRDKFALLDVQIDILQRGKAVGIGLVDMFK